MDRYSDEEYRRYEDGQNQEGEGSVGTLEQRDEEGYGDSRRGNGAEDAEDRKSRKHRSGSRERRRKKKHSDRKRRSRSRDGKRRSRDRRRRSRSRKRRSGSSSRRRGRRDRSRDRSYSPGYYKRQEMQRRRASEPKKFWDGFQWVIQQPSVSENSSQAALSQTRKDRRLYVGNLPPGVTMDQLRDFLNAAMEACGGVPEGQKEAVLSVWIAGPEAKYSFVEFTTTDCATVAIGLNGINCMGFPLKISRPTNYSATIPGPPPAGQTSLLQQPPGEQISQTASAALLAANAPQPDTQALLAAAMGQPFPPP